MNSIEEKQVSETGNLLFELALARAEYAKPTTPFKLGSTSCAFGYGEAVIDTVEALFPDASEPEIDALLRVIIKRIASVYYEQTAA